MKNIKILVVLTLISAFILCSCGEKWEVVFEGADRKALALYNIFQQTNIPSKLYPASSSTLSKLYVPKSQLSNSSIIVAKLGAVFDDNCRENKDNLKKYFVPSFDKGQVEIEQFYSSIAPHSNIEGLIYLQCLKGSGNTYNFNFWYNSNNIKETDLRSYLEENLLSHFQFKTIELEYKFKDLSYLFEEIKVNNKLSDNNKLIIFEPFSFHILDNEKVVAGFQLIVLLVMFLICGFTLGYWWSTKL